MSLSGAGSRRQAATNRRLDALTEAVIEAVTGEPGTNGTHLADALRNQGHSFQKGDPAKAARRAVEEGRLRVQGGPRGAKCYFVADVPRPTPTHPAG